MLICFLSLCQTFPFSDTYDECHTERQQLALSIPLNDVS